jgi:hypothetical protein
MDNFMIMSSNYLFTLFMILIHELMHAFPFIALSVRIE